MITKRCCNLGCNTEKTGNEGYRAACGFMLWACEDHMEIWKAYDQADKEYYEAQGRAFESDYAIWEKSWYENYEREKQRPVMPLLQSSV